MIILEDSTGRQIEVKDGQRYDGKKWHVVDSKPPYENNEPQLNEAVELLREISNDLEGEGIHWGDVLKVMFRPVAKLLGISHCLSCDVRQVIVNSVQNLIKKLGKIEAAKIMKQLIRNSFKQEPVEVLRQLKAILDD